jgi:hypothetical protein
VVRRISWARILPWPIMVLESSTSTGCLYLGGAEVIWRCGTAFDPAVWFDTFGGLEGPKTVFDMRRGFKSLLV